VLCLERLEEGLRGAKVAQKGTTIEVTARADTDFAPLIPKAKALAKARQGDEGQQLKRVKHASENNLKQIALALHSFHDAHKALPPPAILSKDGKPLLSWRVAILPYIEQAPLYMQFKLDEPWDSPHNKKLLESMPNVYAPVGVKPKEPHATFYQVFTGPGTGMESQRVPGALFGARGPSLPRFLDGTANTLLVVEAGEAVPWTKPDDLPYDAKKPPPKLGGMFKDGFHAAFGDGSVRFFRQVDEATLRALITRNGGEVIDDRKLR
jgi:hypothetical protein